MLYIDERAKIIIDILKYNSYEAYIVGGYLRDMLLNRKVNDIDIATDALPGDVINIFKDKYRLVETGLKYGTVTLIIDNEAVEITTYRSESLYIDGRHPENVKFEKNIFADLARRDFTINAMAYNHEKGLVDIFNSKFDLSQKLIRSVFNPLLRFEEDKLRMLRAVRFATQLDFDIEKNTLNAIKKLSPKIEELPSQRINAEIVKMLLSKKPSKSIILMKKTGMLIYIFPVIDEMYNLEGQSHKLEKNLFFHTMKLLDNTKPDIILRLSALFCNAEKLYSKTVYRDNADHYQDNKFSSSIARENLKKLNFPISIINLVCLLVENYSLASHAVTKKSIRELIYKLGKKNINYLACLQRADSSSANTPFENNLKIILEEENVFEPKDMSINGFDIKNMGFHGKQIGQIKKYLFDKILEEPSLNKKEILLNIINEEFTNK